MRIGRAAWRIGLAAVVLGALGAALVARFFGPELLRDVVVREAARQLGMEIRFASLGFELVPPSLVFADLEIVGSGRSLVSVRRVSFDLAVLRSLWDGAWIGDIVVEEPALRIDDAPAAWERIGRLLLEGRGESAGGDEGFRPRLLVVRAARLDLAWPRQDLRVEVNDLSLEARVGGLLRPAAEFEALGRVVAVRRDQRLDLERVAARGKASAASVKIDTLLIEGASGELRAAASVDGDRLQGSVDWDVKLDPIFALLPEAGAVRGGGRIVATFAGTLATPEASADLRANAVRIHDVEFSGTGKLTTRGDSWRLEGARATIFGGEAEGDAHGKIASNVPFEAQARFSRWDPSTFVRLFDVDTPLVGNWSGEARIAGDLIGDDLHGGGKFTLSQGAESLSGTASFAVARERIEVEGLLGAKPQNEIRARYRVIHGTEIAGDVEVRSERLAGLGAFVRLPIEGKGTGRARFAGSVAQPSFGGDLDLRELVLLGVPLETVKGPFEITKRGIRSTGLEIADGQMIATGDFALTANQQNDWVASLRELSLARARSAAALAGIAVPELSGKANGEVRGAGPWGAMRLRCESEIGNLVVAGEEAGSGTVEVVRDAERWSANVDLRRDDGATMRARGVRGHDGTIAGELAVKGVRLEKLAPLHRRWPMLRGSLEAEGALAGTQSRPRGTATVSVSGIAVGEASLGDGQLRLRSDGADVVIEGGIEKIRLTGSSSLTPPNPFRASITWSDFDLAPFLSGPSSVPIVTSGEAALAGDVRQPLGSGSARITRLAVGRDASRLELAAPVIVRVASGAVDVSDAVLAGNGQRVTLAAHWTDEEATFRADGAGDLSLLESLSTAVASARGAVEGHLEGARGGDGAWHYRGRAGLSGGALDFALLVGTTDVFAKVAIDDRSVTLGELKGKVGGGDFLVSGSAVLDGEWNLGWALRDASLGVPSWLDYRASGHGKISGPFTRPLLEGEIEVDQAVYDRRIEWAEFLPWFRKQTRASPSTTTLPLDLDLRVLADGGIFVDNNLAKAEMRADLRVRGGAQALQLDGTIDMLNGEFSFRRRRFTITSGVVRFHDDRTMNPDLAFTGETRIDTRDEEYEIVVQVNGTADDPRIQFTADDPTLTENDVLALVTFGRTVSQLQSQGASIELGEALALTAGPRAETVEKELHTLIPVDRIEIEPSFSRVNGSNEPRLSIAKDLTERFSAVIGTGLGNERNQDVGIEYQFTRRFSLQGSWESQTTNDAGAFGFNVKLRQPFRSLPRFSLLPEITAGR